MLRSFVTISSYLRSVVVAGCVVAASSCGHDATVTSPSQAESRCQPSLSAPDRTFGSSGGTSSVTVSVARGCSWAAATDVPWINITAGGQGQGDGTVSFRVASNPTTTVRAGSLAVSDQRLAMTQQ